MSKRDVLSIFFVAGLIAGWKILSMSNVSWWLCAVPLGAYVLLLFYDRTRKKPA
jgi:membrane-associated protease RseP (regulator of RpoE activity)